MNNIQILNMDLRDQLISKTFKTKSTVDRFCLVDSGPPHVTEPTTLLLLLTYLHRLIELNFHFRFIQSPVNPTQCE